MRQLLLMAILTLCLPAFSFTSSERYEARIRSKNFQRQVQTTEGLREKTLWVLDNMFEKKIYWHLVHAGYAQYARDIRDEWRFRYKNILSSYDIESLPSLTGFISRTYLGLQQTLGYDLCHALRLDDLLTLDHLNVVLNPCPYGEPAFNAVFCGDKHVTPPSLHPHRGFLPVLSFWSTELSISFGTVGLLSWFAGPIALLVEWDVDTAIAPAIEPAIYKGACG